MKDVELALRTAYFQLLNNISADGKTVPFYDRKAPAGAIEPYIIWFGCAQVANNTKSEFGNDVTVDLLVYQSYKGDFGGTKEADQIANAVTQALMPSPGTSGINPASIQVVVTKLVGLNSEFIKHDTKDTYRKRITIEHLISQEP